MNPPPLSRQNNAPSTPGPALPSSSSNPGPTMTTPSQLSRQVASPRLRRVPTAETATPRSSRLRQEVFSADQGEDDEDEMDVDDK